jgi:hypothetical protein
MSYISRLPQSSFSAKFLWDPDPVSNSAPSAPPKRRPHKRNSLHSDLQIQNIQIGPPLSHPFSSATATPPFLFFFCFDPRPGHFPLRPTRTAR